MLLYRSYYAYYHMCLIPLLRVHVRVSHTSMSEGRYVTMLLVLRYAYYMCLRLVYVRVSHTIMCEGRCRTSSRISLALKLLMYEALSH